VAWSVERVSTTAADFHARDLPAPVERAVWVCDATAPALVLGSTQPEADVDRAACAAAGIEVVRRRSGGGAVLVVPGDLVWVDLVLPAGDPLWEHDVARAFLWVGDVWRAALAELDVEATVHRGGLEPSRWSPTVCFAGRGSGEVFLGSGAKVVGLAQRRTRAGARFQCAGLLRWDPEALVGLLAAPPPVAELASVAAGLPVDGEDLLAAFLRHLPD
jgi:lipoate-protein ligase A